MGILDGDIDQDKYEDVRRMLMFGDLRRIFIEDIKITWMGGCLIATTQKEQLNGVDAISDHSFVTPGNWTPFHASNILGKEFFSVLSQGQKSELLRTFVEKRFAKRERSPFLLPYGFVAYTNLFGGYTVSWE